MNIILNTTIVVPEMYGWTKFKMDKFFRIHKKINNFYLEKYECVIF